MLFFVLLQPDVWEEERLKKTESVDVKEVLNLQKFYYTAILYAIGCVSLWGYFL